MSPPPAKRLSFAAAAFALLLAWLAPLHGVGPLAAEVDWLAAGGGVAAPLLDRWVGSQTSAQWMRAPGLLIAALVAGLATRAAARTLRPQAALACGLALAALPLVLAASAAVEVAGLVALWSAWSWWAATGSRPYLGCSVLAAAGAILDPTLVGPPLGAALGRWLGGRAGRASRGVTVFLTVGSLIAVSIYGLTPGWAGAAWTGLPFDVQQWLLLAAALVGVAGLYGDEATRRLVGPAYGGALLAVVWLTVRPLREASTAPLAALAVLLPLAAIATLAQRRRGSWLALAVPALAIVAVAGYLVSPPPAPLPIAAGLEQLRRAAPGLRTVVPGPGLSAGALRQAAGNDWTVAEGSPAGTGRVGALRPADGPPPGDGSEEFETALGARVLARYGVEHDTGGSVLWSVYRPYRLTADTAARRPNVVLITVDTLRPDRLSMYGYARATSPALDAWAAGATLYERAVSTAAVTLPGIASLMTGRLPLAHGLRDAAATLDPGNVTLAEMLAAAGYETAAFVSTPPLAGESSGLRDGFGSYDAELTVGEVHGRRVRSRTAPDVCEAAWRWLGPRREGGRPWFVWVHTADPQGPYDPLPGYRGSFSSSGNRELARASIPDYQWLGTTRYETYHDAYDDEIRQTDASLGVLLERVLERPGPDGALVVLTSDHGEAFGERGRYFTHGQSLHEEELRIPLVIHDTAAPRAARVATPVSLLDVVPTVLAAAGITTDLPLDGMPLSRREETGEPLAAGWRPGEAAVYQGRLKLIADRRGVRAYDLGRDSAESEPLDVSAAGGDLRRALRALLERDPLARR